jgi:hypothetical protein
MQPYKHLQMTANEAKDNYFRFWFSEFLYKGMLVDEAKAKAISFTEQDLKLIPGSFTPIIHTTEVDLEMYWTD